ncbi:MAG: mycothiol conjugate amidase Mca [Acidimicrobiia bacterium]|nr:mycothiol conjugate amidase Mca [Acidimicrobiia bacterium]
MSAAPLCLLQVHAHPDDESSKGACTAARYAAEGVRNVLVCCTGGEEGDILNPAMENDEVRANLIEVRKAELEAAVKIIGYEAVHLLGYRDSGMAGTPANEDPENFANADPDEAVARLVAVIRRERPQVVITYGEDQSRYPHPDHLQVHTITLPAYNLAGDFGYRPELGRPWRPSKLYYSHGFSRRRVLAQHEWFLDQGMESPFASWVEKIPEDLDISVTTRVDVSDWLDVGRDALRAHRTQVDPEGHWFRMPTVALRGAHPWEEYQLARTSVGTGPVDEDGLEHDLFGGLR